MRYFCTSMLSFRRHIGAKFMAFFTGIIFLNMSFFLCEIRLLGLHLSHTQMVENVIKALAGVGFEEEKDAANESGSNEAGHAVDLHMLVHPVNFDSFSSISKLYGCTRNLEVASAISEIVTPPPKLS
jgi:hypothetical protein